MRLPRLTGFVRKLVAGLFAAYVVELLLRQLGGLNLAALLALEPGGPFIWQLVTYVLVQGGNPPFFFLLGMVFLWWALSPFESGFGARRTAQLCGVCVLAAGVTVYTIGLFATLQPLAGSSPLWYGGLMATTYLYRDRELSLFGAFSMTGRQLMAVLVGLTLLNFLFDSNLTAFLADVGAMAGAIAFVRWMRRPRTPARKPKKKRQNDKGLRVIKGGMSDDDEPPTWLN